MYTMPTTLADYQQLRTDSFTFTGNSGIHLTSIESIEKDCFLTQTLIKLLQMNTNSKIQTKNSNPTFIIKQKKNKPTPYYETKTDHIHHTYTHTHKHTIQKHNLITAKSPKPTRHFARAELCAFAN